ncbi:hypothetical protein EDC96DRAFT_529415 [Choanephora cucurbitarum]|nr:hypothetical protein EDC96DRAFT_529415 [Choanephora cucurbitarum]
MLAASRKSRFELELAVWETNKMEHQLELVQKQWEENGMEELVREESRVFAMTAVSGNASAASIKQIVSTGANFGAKLAIL